MAPKKPKAKDKKPKAKKRTLIGRTKTGRQIVTTDVGPSLDRAPHDMEAKFTALARGTDALVTRVVNSAKESARDPSEHLLDLSRAYYNEESAMGQHSVQCDRCLLKSPGMASQHAAIKVAESIGWVVTDAYDHCPVCKDGGLLLPGATTALAVPPKLTSAEMILVVRMRYIVDKVRRGVSLDAFLQNAERSQHRSMLSDLAQESNYDTVPLIEKVTSLVTRGVDVLETSEEAEKIWPFMLALYERLKKEDHHVG